MLFFFGTQASTDIYFYSIATIGMLIAFLIAIDNSVIIPESIRIREQETEKESQQFLTFFLYLYVAIGIIAIGILLIDPIAIFSSISKFNKVSLTKNIELLYWTIPLCFLMLITTYLIDILASYKYFTLPMIASAINSIFSLSIVIIFHHILELKSIVLGITIGYLINITSLLSIMYWQLQWNFVFKLISLRKKIVRNIFYAQAGNISSLFASYIPLYLLSGFNSGIITALNYGKNISEIPNQMITSQFSVVSGIKFNELVARHEFKKLNDIFLDTLKFLIFILTPISGLFFVFSDDIIKFLLMRGAFDSHSVNDTALFFKYFGLMLPLLAVNTIVARIFMATQKINYAFLYQIVTNLFQMISLFIFIKYLGIIGYPLAMILIYSISVIALYPILKITISDLEYLKVAIHFFVVVIINSTIGYAVYKFKYIMQSNYIIETILGSFIYLILLVLINESLNINPQFKLKNIWNLKGTT